MARLPRHPHHGEAGPRFRDHPHPQAGHLPGPEDPRHSRAASGLLGRLHPREPRRRRRFLRRHRSDRRAVARHQRHSQPARGVPRAEISHQHAVAGGRLGAPDAQDGDLGIAEARSARGEDLPLPPQARGHRRSESGSAVAEDGLPPRLRAGRGLYLHLMPALLLAALLAQAVEHAAPPPAQRRLSEQQQSQAANAAAVAAGAGAAIVATQEGVLPNEDPFAFPAPRPAARQFFGYASPWTLLMLAAALVAMAELIRRFTPVKRKRIKRATILFMLYLTTFMLAAILGMVHAEGWSRRVWFLADLFEVLVVIDLVAILLFDLVLFALRIEVANIVHDLALGAAYILAFIGILHRSGVHLSGIIATHAVVTVVLGLSLQATLGNVLGGIALQLDDSIHVGDWLQLATGQQGRITAIRWRHTVVETRNWDTIIVPNSSLLEIGRAHV